MRTLEPISETEDKKIVTSGVRLRPRKTETPTNVRDSLMKRLTRFINIKKTTNKVELNKIDESLTMKYCNISTAEEQTPVVNHLKDNLYYKVQRVGLISEIIKSTNQDIQCSWVIEDKIYIGLKNNAEVHILCYDEKTQTASLDNVWQTVMQDFPIYPLQIKSDRSGNIYLSGYFCPKINEDEKMYLLIKYDKDRNVLIKTKKYNFHRFSDFDFDDDGNLVIISSTKSDDNIHHVCKMSANFDKIFYKFNFSSMSSKYVPERVVCLGVNGRTWLGAYKEGLGGNESRLICFNSSAVKTADNSMAEFMEKVNICAWCSGNFLPTQMIKFSGDCILAIDENTKALFCLSWDQMNQCPDVIPVSSQGQPSFTSMCSNLDGRAYLFTNNIIYRFDIIDKTRKC